MPLVEVKNRRGTVIKMEKLREKISFKIVILIIDIMFIITSLSLVILYGVGSFYLRIPELNRGEWLKYKITDQDKKPENLFWARTFENDRSYYPWKAAISTYSLLILFSIIRHLKPSSLLYVSIISFICTIMSILIYVFWGSLDFGFTGKTHGIFPLISASWNLLLTSIFSSVYVSKNVQFDG